MSCNRGRSPASNFRGTATSSRGRWSPMTMNLAFLPPSWHEEVLHAPFSLPKYLRSQARLATMAPDYTPFRALKMMQGYLDKEEWRPEHLPDPRSLTDEDLKLTIRK